MPPPRPLHVHAVTPIHIDAQELARRQARYHALSPRGLVIELHDVGPGAPRALDSEQDIRDSEGLVSAALERAPDHADALLADCVLDPGVRELSARLERPVFGLLRTTLTWAALAGRPSGAATRNTAIAEELARQVRGYGLDAGFTGVEVLDLGVEATCQGTAWADALRAVAGRAGAAGAADLLNGCSAVDLPADATCWPVRVLDPTARALALVAAGERR